jgi:hypothetical protein
MFIIEQDVQGEKYLIKDYIAYDDEGKKDLEKICEDLNTSKYADYKIVELEGQFICECCKAILFSKNRNKNECKCGALRCEYCEDIGLCACNIDDYIEGGEEMDNKNEILDPETEEEYDKNDDELGCDMLECMDE